MLTTVRMASVALLFFVTASVGVFAQEAAPEKPYLGIVVEQADTSSPVVILDVNPDGPAAPAGVKAGDAIESINGIAISKTEDMANALKGKGVGSTLKFVVKRGEESITANVKLIAAPSGAPSGGVEVEERAPPTTEDGAPLPLPPPDSAGPTAPSNPGPARPYLGLTVVPTNGKGGASISSIRKDSPAARAGFPLGGVIFKVNDLAVQNPDDLIDYIASLEPGATIELSYMHNERLYRKQVKLSSIGGSTVYAKPGTEDVEAPPPAPTPGGGKASPLFPKEDRPILKGIERVLGGGPVVPGGGAAPSAQQQIDDLRSLVSALEERIGKLEAELASMKGVKPEETPAPPPAAAP